MQKELRKIKEEESRKIEWGETSKTFDLDTKQGELAPLDVPPYTTLTGGHLPLQELGYTKEKEEEVLDLTKFTFDQVSFKIMQERKNYYEETQRIPFQSPQPRRLCLTPL